MITHIQSIQESSQLIYDANRLTSFSVTEISIKWYFWEIFEIIFFGNRILLLLSVLHLAWFIVYLVFFTLYCFSILVCVNLVGKMFSRFNCFDLRQRCLLTPLFGLYNCFEHSFVDWKDSCFQRCRLIWPNIEGQWKLPTADTLSLN